MHAPERLTKDDVFRYLESRGWQPTRTNPEYWTHPHFTPEAMRSRSIQTHRKKAKTNTLSIREGTGGEWWWPNALAAQMEREQRQSGGCPI